MAAKYIDIHTHLNFAAYNADRDAVIARMQDTGVGVINVGTQANTSAQAIELAEQNEHMYAAIGLHPIHTAKSFHDEKELGEGGQEFTSRGEVFDDAVYKKMAEHPKVVAIGECGLDYFRLDADTKEKQVRAFEAQIALANSVKKPLMMHIRNAYRDAHEIFKAHAKVTGNLHFFAGTIADAKPFLDQGCTFSFTGVITFADSYHEVIKYLPLDRIMSETDAPYVAPAPYRGKRNEPSFVVQVVKKIAEIKGLDEEIVRTQILSNASRVFGMPF